MQNAVARSHVPEPPVTPPTAPQRYRCPSPWPFQSQPTIRHWLDTGIYRFVARSASSFCPEAREFPHRLPHPKTQPQVRRLPTSAAASIPSDFEAFIDQLERCDISELFAETKDSFSSATSPASTVLEADSDPELDSLFVDSPHATPAAGSSVPTRPPTSSTAEPGVRAGIVHLAPPSPSSSQHGGSTSVERLFKNFSLVPATVSPAMVICWARRRLTPSRSCQAMMSSSMLHIEVPPPRCLVIMLSPTNRAATQVPRLHASVRKPARRAPSASPTISPSSAEFAELEILNDTVSSISSLRISTAFSPCSKPFGL